MKDQNGTGRRGFLKSMALAGGIAAPGAEAQQPQAAPAKTAVAPRARIDYPRTFTGRQLQMIAFPLGGVGAGSIALGGRGQLRDWEIFNRPDKGKSPAYAFASVWARGGNGKRPARPKSTPHCRRWPRCQVAIS